MFYTHICPCIACLQRIIVHETYFQYINQVCLQKNKDNFFLRKEIRARQIYQVACLLSIRVYSWDKWWNTLIWQYGRGKILAIDDYSCISLEAVNNFFLNFFLHNIILNVWHKINKIQNILKVSVIWELKL